MIRLIILIVMLCACFCLYHNFDSIKDTTINSIKNEKTIKNFNAIKYQNEKKLNDALNR